MRSVRVVGGAVLAGVLVACSGGGGEQPTSLPTLGSPSPTVTAVQLEVPAEARAHTPQGAAAFVRFFFTELDAAYQAGRPFPLDGLADPACAACKGFAGVADSFAKQGHRYDGPSFSSITSEAPPIEAGYSYVTFSFLAPARREVDAGGRVVATTPDEGRVTFTVAAKLVPQGWLLRATKVDQQ